MNKKIIIGAIALMGVFGGLTTWQSMSGQNEAKTIVQKVRTGTQVNSHCWWPGNFCVRLCHCN